MGTLKIGIIGCGYWGPNLIRNFVEIPNSDVVAVADLDEERLSFIQSRFPQIQLTRDYHDLLLMGLDAIAIATPPATHFDITKECLENNIHVLLSNKKVNPLFLLPVMKALDNDLSNGRCRPVPIKQIF